MSTAVDQAMTALACATTTADREAAYRALAIAALVRLSDRTAEGGPVESRRERAQRFREQLAAVIFGWEEVTGVDADVRLR